MSTTRALASIHRQRKEKQSQQVKETDKKRPLTTGAAASISHRQMEAERKHLEKSKSSRLPKTKNDSPLSTPPGKSPRRKIDQNRLLSRRLEAERKHLQKLSSPKKYGEVQQQQSIRVSRKCERDQYSMSSQQSTRSIATSIKTSDLSYGTGTFKGNPKNKDHISQSSRCSDQFDIQSCNSSICTSDHFTNNIETVKEFSNTVENKPTSLVEATANLHIDFDKSQIDEKEAIGDCSDHKKGCAEVLNTQHGNGNVNSNKENIMKSRTKKLPPVETSLRNIGKPPPSSLSSRETPNSNGNRHKSKSRFFGEPLVTNIKQTPSQQTQEIPSSSMSTTSEPSPLAATIPLRRTWSSGSFNSVTSHNSTCSTPTARNYTGAQRKFKPKINKNEIQATNGKSASVKKLSQWLDNDPFESHKKQLPLRRGRNIVNKSRIFEQAQPHTNIDGNVQNQLKGINASRKEWIMSGMKKEPEGEAEGGSSTTPKVNAVLPSPNGSVTDRANWLQKDAFQKKSLQRKVSLEAQDGSVSDRAKWLREKKW